MAESWGTNKVVKEGWLQKRGEFIKNWRARYFVLRSDGTFTGYKQPPVGGIYPEIMNEFNVEGISVIPRHNVKKNAFMVRVLHMTSFVERIFCADTTKDMEEWVEVIKTTSERLRSKRRPSPSLYDDNSDQLDSSGPAGGNGYNDDNEDTSQSVGGGGRSSANPRAAPRKPKPKQKTIDDFEMLKVLGKGTFGKVVLCREIQSQQLYAMKILKKDFIEARDEVEHTETERKILKTMKHPFLTALEYSFQTPNRLCFVMEYVSGGELFFHLTKTKGFGEERSRFYGAEISLAIGYLHQNSIVYRDLKLENLLLDSDGHVKLTDFGLCKEDVGYGSTTATFCGTPEYLAPEVLCESDYGKSVDWWGLGIVLYEMISGKLPFFHRDQDELFQAILNDDVKFPKNMSDNARAMLGGLLQKEPELRLGSSKRDVEELKAHAFFAGINWIDLLEKRIKPPFQPVIKGEDDTSNFDPSFTSEDPNRESDGEGEEVDFTGI